MLWTFTDLDVIVPSGLIARLGELAEHAGVLLSPHTPHRVEPQGAARLAPLLRRAAEATQSAHRIYPYGNLEPSPDAVLVRSEPAATTLRALASLCALAATEGRPLLVRPREPTGGPSAATT